MNLILAGLHEKSCSQTDLDQHVTSTTVIRCTVKLILANQGCELQDNCSPVNVISRLQCAHF